MVEKENIEFEYISEILKIIEAGLEGNKEKLKNYALLLKSKIKDKRLAKALQDKIDGKKGNLVYAKEGGDGNSSQP